MAKKKKVKTKAKSKGVLPIMFTMAVVLAIVFLPSTIILAIGMIPSYVAIFVYGRQAAAKALTVASVNLTGCSPFLFDLWVTDHAIQNAIHIISNPTSILVMFGAAGLGYVADWMLTNIIIGLLYEQSKLRLKTIKKQQADLVKRWGEKVKGKIPLDSMGFPLETKK